MPFTFPDGSVPGVCNVCGTESWSKRSNKCLEHKPAPVEKKPRKGKAAPKPTLNPDGSPKSVTTRVIESAAAIDSKTFSGKAPTKDEWEEKLTGLVVLLTMTYVELGVVRPLKMGEPASTNAVAALGMTDAEAATIVEPFSYLIAGSKINKQRGREAIEFLAFAPAILAIIEWTNRVSAFRQQFAVQQGDTSVRFESTPTEEGTRSPSSGPPIANFTGVTDPDQAPTKRVNGNRPYLDAEVQS